MNLSLVDRLTSWPAAEDGDALDAGYVGRLMEDATAEIERLRRLLARYRDETPLGHQPHMIAHEVDEALGR